MARLQATPLPLACCLMAALLACTDDTPADGESTGDSKDTGETTGDGDGDTTGDGDGDGDTTGDGDGDGDPAECGNGIVEGDEVCDDGNRDDTDFCTSACTSPCAPLWTTQEPEVVIDDAILRSELAIDSAGNLIAVGSRSVGDELHAWVAKYDPTGETKLWEATFASNPGDSYVGNLAIGPDDEVYATGTWMGTDAEDQWIARLAAADGSEVWVNEYDGALDMGDDAGNGIAVAADGIVVVGTATEVEMDSDIRIAKLDFDGNELWSTTYGGAVAANGYSLDRGSHAAVAEDGTIYVLGHIYVDFETVDLAILSYAADGTGPDWELMPHAGGTGHDFYGDAIALDDQGFLYLAMTNVDSPVGTFWVDKYALDTGMEVWSMSNDGVAVIGDTSDWVITDLVPRAGGLALSGFWYNEDYNEGSGRWQAYLAHFDGDANPLCYGGWGHDVPPSEVANPVYGGGVVLNADGQALAEGWIATGAGADHWLAQYGTPD